MKDARGFSLIEAIVALAVSSVLAVGSIAGLRRVADGMSLDAGRTVVVSALLEARRIAYAGEAPVDLVTTEGSGSVLLRGPSGSGHAIALPARVVIHSGPADGVVTFRPSGLADNATVRLRIAGGALETAVIVNQRGVVR